MTSLNGVRKRRLTAKETSIAKTEIQIQNHQSKSESKGVFLMKNAQAS